MKRTVVFAVAAFLMTAGAFAQRPMMQGANVDAPAGPCIGGMQRGMQMQQGPMASMMGAMDTAVHGNFVYVLQGNMLEKRDMDGNMVKSVQLEDMQQVMDNMQAVGVCPMCGMPTDMDARAGCPGTMEGEPCPRCGRVDDRGMDGQGMRGRMMGEGATEMGMRGMQLGRMHSKVKLEADADGVYLLRGGNFTKFDHDLRKVKSWDAVSAACLADDDSVQCAMREMRRSQCPTCRMMTGRLIDERKIESGSVAMWHRPAVLTTGVARFQVQVNGLSSVGDTGAKVSAYLYPKGNVNAGMGVLMTSVGGGNFFGLVDIPNKGSWELSLRITRPGMEDVKVYYDVSVE